MDNCTMGSNDPQIAEQLLDDGTTDRAAKSERAVALGPSATPRTTASRTASPHRNNILLKALTDGAKVRIRVTGEIAKNRFPGNADTRRDSDVAISRIDEKDDLDSLWFTGGIVEFEATGEGSVVTVRLPREPAADDDATGRRTGAADGERRDGTSGAGDA
jgi:hypothetical protein